MELVQLVQHEVHSIANWIHQKYWEYLYIGDPRTQHFFGVRTPWFTLSMVGTYLLFVTKIGPRLMKNREPFQLRAILIVYNLLITIFNAYIFWMMGTYGWFGRYNMKCEPVSYFIDPDELRMVDMSYLYFITKFIELLDTVFFVLRKKNRQLSYLHIYHHSIMPINVYLGMKFCASGHVTFFGMLNSFIHIPMYLYYGLSACGQTFQRYLWWKKYLTMMQLIQFVIVGIHSIVGLVNGCGASTPLLVTLVLNTIIFIFFFSNFYLKNYNVKNEAKSNGRVNGSIHSGHEKNGRANGVKHDPANGIKNGGNAIEMHALHSNGVANGVSASKSKNKTA